MKKHQNIQILTKADLETLATKEDLNDLEKKIETKLGAKLDKIANTLDGFVGTVDDLRIENEVGANQIKDLRERVTKLESPAV